MSRITQISKAVRLLLFLVATLYFGSFWLTVFLGSGSSNEFSVDQGWSAFVVQTEVSGSWKGFAQALEQEGFNSLLILGTAELLPLAMVYLFVFRLFGLYQQGLIFTQRNINCFRNIGSWLLIWIVIKIFYPVLVTLILRFSGASDSLSIIVTISSVELNRLLIGLVIYAIGWVMAEANKLQHEQELVI
jgi:hypothetical protein